MILPPEVLHLKGNLDGEARNCDQAAAYRNIHKWEELKTLILTWNDEFHVFNLPGNRIIHLPHEDYRWMSPDALAKFGLESGTINPFSIRDKMPFVERVAFCSSVFTIPSVFTNDGTLTGTFVIPTAILTREFPNADVFEFSAPEKEKRKRRPRSV